MHRHRLLGYGGIRDIYHPVAITLEFCSVPLRCLWLDFAILLIAVQLLQHTVLWQNQYLSARWLMYSLEKGERPEQPTQK